MVHIRADIIGVGSRHCVFGVSADVQLKRGVEALDHQLFRESQFEDATGAVKRFDAIRLLIKSDSPWLRS